MRIGDGDVTTGWLRNLCLFQNKKKLLAEEEDAAALAWKQEGIEMSD